MCPPRVPWSEMTAFFGGVFDPPHLGHFEAVKGIKENPGVKNVRVLPTPMPYYKSGFAKPVAIEDRVALLEFYFDPKDIDNLEILRHRRNPEKPIYTYDTLSELQSSNGEIAYVLGTDQLILFHTWHQFPYLLELSNWIILLRKPDQISDNQKLREQIFAIMKDWENRKLVQPIVSGVQGHSTFEWNVCKQKTKNTHLGFCKVESPRLLIVPTDSPPISSTQIRNEILRTGLVPEGTMSSRAIDYLRNKRLYGIRGTP